jgi:hypothetical protein
MGKGNADSGVNGWMERLFFGVFFIAYYDGGSNVVNTELQYFKLPILDFETFLTPG